MRTSQLTLLPALGLFSASTVADFVIGEYSGQQLSGTFQTPRQLGVTGTWISTSKFHYQSSIPLTHPSYLLKSQLLTTSSPLSHRHPRPRFRLYNLPLLRRGHFDRCKLRRLERLNQQRLLRSGSSWLPIYYAHCQVCGYFLW